MRMPRRSHRATQLAARTVGLALVTATLALVGPALMSPTLAAEGCTTEVGQTSGPPLNIPTGPGCDDTTPPDTTIDSVSPAPNAQDWIQKTEVTFTFHGTHTDGDPDSISYECQFYNSATAPDTWAACTSPAKYDQLQDTSDTPYTFRVRAIDTADDNIDLTTDVFFPQDTDQPDFDQTPAERIVRVDTKAPIARIFEGPYDVDGTGWPIAVEPKVTYVLASDPDAVEFRCQLDGATVPCHEGENTFTRIKGGEHQLRVGVKDRAGNEDESPETKQFVMPYNLTSAKGWKRNNGAGWFAGDVLQTKKYGATAKFKAQNVKQIALIAPANPKLGKIQVRIGDWLWKTYDLSKGKKTKSRFIDLRGPNPSLFTGPVQIRNITGGKLVQVDAYVFPHS